MVVELLNTVVVCKRCRPGFQTSQLCLEHFQMHSHKQIKKEQLKGYYSQNSVKVSSCTACVYGTFTDTFLPNQTCRRCKYCSTGHFVEKRCSATTDTKCIPHWKTNYKHITTGQIGLEHFYISHLQLITYSIIITKRLHWYYLAGLNYSFFCVHFCTQNKE